MTLLTLLLGPFALVEVVGSERHTIANSAGVFLLGGVGSGSLPAPVEMEAC
jgi:hypothetical protein